VKVAVLLLLAVTLAGRLWVALADYRRLIGADVWQDDAFYYLKIAQNILAGRGVTFDGHTPTNGFHPLFMALVAAVMSVEDRDPARIMHLVGLLSAIVATATGALVFLLQRRLSGTWTAVYALAIWALSPYFTVFGVNGQETGLAVLFTVLLILLYHRLIARGAAADGVIISGRAPRAGWRSWPDSTSRFSSAPSRLTGCAGRPRSGSRNPRR
jgi:hypothetical protein